MTSDGDIADQLTMEVDERLDQKEPEEWGEEVSLAEGEKFFGRFLDTQVSPVTDRPVLLALARNEDGSWNGPPVFLRVRTMLQSELDRVRPVRGDHIVVARGDDREGKENTYHWYALSAAPCPDPLPESAGGGAPKKDDIPFAPSQ